MKEVAQDHVTHIMGRHDVAVHVGFALWTIEPPEVDLAHEFMAQWVFLGSVKFINSHHNVAKGPDLKGKKKESMLLLLLKKP